MQRKLKAAKWALMYGDNFLKGQRDRTHSIHYHFSKTSKDETRRNISLKHIKFQTIGASSKTENEVQAKQQKNYGGKSSTTYFRDNAVGFSK